MNMLPRRPGNVILRAEQAKAWTDGFAFLDQARQRATDQEEEIRQAREVGYAEGLAAGRQQGERDAAELLIKTHADVDHYLAALEPKLGGLVLNLMQRLLGEFDDAERIAMSVRQALGEWRQAQRPCIRVAPELVDRVTEHLAQHSQAATDLSVEADPGLGPSQCLLVSPTAVMNLGIETQLETIAEALSSNPGRKAP